MSDADAAWPPHQAETVPWRQSSRGGNRDDRMVREISAAIPPLIADLSYVPSPELSHAAESAHAEVGRLDAVSGGDLGALAQLLTRTEAVSSSKIEQITASLDDYARAVGGSRANPSAQSMVAATSALVELVDRAGQTGAITVDDMLRAHAALMADDPHESSYAGRLRDIQNWIGGSDYSPRGAVHVPPTPRRVHDLMADLETFANRDDLPILVQAAIVHAQFESIHPFTDGNGRIGRALINAVLRRRGLTRHVIVPIASAMVADRQDYFDRVNAYRVGDVGGILTLVVRATEVAAHEAAMTAGRIEAISGEWAALSRPRAGSGLAALIQTLPTVPVLTSDDAVRITGKSLSNTLAALDRLEADGILTEVTGRKRDRVYAAGEVLAEIAELERRVGVAMATRR